MSPAHCCEQRRPTFGLRKRLTSPSAWTTCPSIRNCCRDIFIFCPIFFFLPKSILLVERDDEIKLFRSEPVMGGERSVNLVYYWLAQPGLKRLDFQNALIFVLVHQNPAVALEIRH